MKGASKWDYVRQMSERYQQACRKEKRLILDELEKKRIGKKSCDPQKKRDQGVEQRAGKATERDSRSQAPVQ